MKSKFKILGVSVSAESIISNIIGNLVGGAVTAIVVGLAMFHYERHITNSSTAENEIAAQKASWARYTKMAHNFCTEWEKNRNLAIDGNLPPSGFMTVMLVQPPFGVEKILSENEIDSINSAINSMHRTYLDLSGKSMEYVTFKFQLNDPASATQLKPAYDAALPSLLKTIENYCVFTQLRH